MQRGKQNILAIFIVIFLFVISHVSALNDVCLYASSATATSENTGSEARFATGAPDSPSSGVCTSWGGIGYSWNPVNWNVKANLTLTYENLVNVNNFTIIGDYNMCWDRIWLKNSQTGETLSVFTGPNTDCILTREVSSYFADTIILETCGWSWSSTDAVQICGKTNITNDTNSTIICGNGIKETGEECDLGINNGNTCTPAYGGICTYCSVKCEEIVMTDGYCGDGLVQPAYEECDDGNVVNDDSCSSICKIETPSTNVSKNICQYASSATATSENTGSEARFATGAPDSPSSGVCTSWGGIGYSWNPVNWNVIANITLTYDKLVYANNLTIFGDYDMCFRNIWVKNGKTGEIKNIFSGNDNNCSIQKNVNNFLTDTIILETCGWSWSSTDAVQLCGNSSENQQPNKVEICPWKNCRKGAASISVDDYYDSCMNELEALGYRGTYCLTDTGSYSSELWQRFDNAFKMGHEIATHTESHLCNPISDVEYIQDMENNIEDITSHTSVKRTDIITHVHPCGYTNQDITKILQSNWNFLSARGYYFNALETKSPDDLFNLKSFNSHGYPGDDFEPPDYFTIVDQAEEEGKWATLVFHIECDDDGVINYLPTRDLWVDTIGNVVRYIYLRDNSQISNYQETSQNINFRIDAPVSMDNQIYNQNLTLKVYINNKQANKVEVDGDSTSYNILNNSEGNYLVFDVSFPINDSINISLI